MPKKDKKHAKENSGIAAAVTKQTAGKFSSSHGTNTNGSSNNSSANPSLPTSNESTPPINTPEVLKPSSVPDNVNAAPSPLLDALSNASVSASTVPSMNNDWGKGGVLAGSPGNLISIMGDSPPTQPSSYEDSSGRGQSGWATHRAFITPSPASPSPPNNVRRPLSFQMDAHYQHPDSLPPTVSSAAYRRSSLHSQISHARNGSQPPLPRQPQAHFYGTTDLDLTLKPQAGMKAGDRGYFFGFDTLPMSGDASGAAENVVVAGFEGGLDVYKVCKRRIEPVGGLKGLRGGVVHAKILPWTVTGEHKSLFPLIAVVVHGPVISFHGSDPTVGQSANASPRPDGAASPRSTYGPAEGFLGHQSATSARAYQTSVHVYSLKTNKLVDTLLQSPQIPISSAISLTSPIFQAPPPSGSFTIKADAGTVAVCSGVTGECWIYLQLLESQNESIFACVGKLWTSIQQSRRTEAPEGSDKTHPAVASSPRLTEASPIITLNGRWIAYCPSAPSSQLSLKAHVPVPLLGRSNSALSLTPPQLPPATSSVDLISDSIVNKIMRETTQELISGAKWVGQQSLQAWNAYWNKSTSPQSQTPTARSAPATQFPPTHGTAGQAASKEPGIVSIVDAESLPASSTIHPITSFVPPQGCSFLSFAPSSLSLFTASSKGDVQNVWDLLRIQHTKSSPLQASVSPNESTGPQVRQIAHFSRMTVARIIDVTWAEPLGESLAVTTERGTVHLLEMPFSASMWPPPRRRKAVQENNQESGDAPNSAVSIAAGAFGAAYQAARPFVSRSRRSSAAVSPANAGTLKDSAAHGGRVIAASISSSLGKTGTAISQLRNTGENRISLPPSSSPPGTSCVRWVRGRRAHSLYILGGGLIRIFPNKSRRPSSRSSRRNSRTSHHKDIRLPALPDDVVAPAIRQILDLGTEDDVFDLSDRDMDVDNTVTLPRARHHIKVDEQSFEAAIPQAELESSAPYQPFHTDRRVALCEYNGQTQSSDMDMPAAHLEQHNVEGEKPQGKKKKSKQQVTIAATNSGGCTGPANWAFGQEISTIKLDLGSTAILDEDLGELDDQALPPSAMERVMEYGDHEQIVVTTRRRRSARQGDAEGDGFFEDDCEVLDFADQRV